MLDGANSAEEQGRSLLQVNTAVNQMDQMTQQNAAMVEETTAACQSLGQEAGRLLELVGQFRTETRAPLAGRPSADVVQMPPRARVARRLRQAD